MPATGSMGPGSLLALVAFCCRWSQVRPSPCLALELVGSFTGTDGQLCEGSALGVYADYPAASTLRPLPSLQRTI